MLNRLNRITTAADFKATRRQSKRVPTSNVLVFVKQIDDVSRFGFTVSTKVGNATVRNKVKRRMRHIAADIIAQHPTGINVVVQALPGAADATYEDLAADIARAVRKR